MRKAGDTIEDVEAVWVDPRQCPSCASVEGAEYIVLRPYERLDVQAFFGSERVEVAVSCARCHHRQTLLQTYPLNLRWRVFDQVQRLEEALAVKTGLPVIVDPPNDPRAGVREPRRPEPSAGSPGAQLIPPK